MTDLIVSVGRNYDIILKDDTLYENARIISKDDMFLEIVYSDRLIPTIKKTAILPFVQILKICPIRDVYIWALEPDSNKNSHFMRRRFTRCTLTEEELELSVSEGAALFRTEDEVKAAINSLIKEDRENGIRESDVVYQYQKEDGSYENV